MAALGVPDPRVSVGPEIAAIIKKDRRLRSGGDRGKHPRARIAWNWLLRPDGSL